MRTFPLALLLLSLGLAAQDPAPEHRDDPFKDDPHARCMRPEVIEYYPADPSLHACSCHQTCVLPGVDEDFAPYVQEDHACAMYCSKQRCGCHPDASPCPAPEVTTPR